jgi:chromosome segregation ATPase
MAHQLTTTSYSAVTEAQGVLREVKERTSKAFSETKRCETESRALDGRREKMLRDVHTISAEIAVLNEECSRQQTRISHYPEKISTLTQKTEQVLKQWGNLHEEIVRFNMTEKLIQTEKENRKEKENFFYEKFLKTKENFNQWIIEKELNLKLEIENLQKIILSEEFNLATVKTDYFTIKKEQEVTLIVFF